MRDRLSYAAIGLAIGSFLPNWLVMAVLAAVVFCVWFLAAK
jgi:hypothetical protein